MSEHALLCQRCKATEPLRFDAQGQQCPSVWVHLCGPLPPPKPPNPGCNRHTNCAEASAKAKAKGRTIDCCSDENCEDCFGT